MYNKLKMVQLHLPYKQISENCDMYTKDTTVKPQLSKLSERHTLRCVGKSGLVFTNILILRIILFLEFSKNFVE